MSEMGNSIEISELPWCYRIYLKCPKCGKRGLAFISKKSVTRYLRVYHDREGYSCLMMKASTKWNGEIEGILNLLGV